MNTNKQHITSDEALLNAFFAEHRWPIADDGFTERVMAALPLRDTVVAEQLRLHRWSLGLNIFGIVAVIALLMGLGFFSRAWEFLHTDALHFLVGILHIDYDGLLVQVMLFMHRLPENLPSVTQLAAIVLTLMILTGLAVKKLASEQD